MQITKCIIKKRSKFPYNDAQNEMLRLMAFTILQDIAYDINESLYYYVMANKITDSSNCKQFIICIKWVDEDLDPHKDFIGLFKLDSIKSERLVASIKDIQIRLAIM